MRCAAIQDGKVVNVVEIGAEHVAAYEDATGLTLIEITDVMNVDIGDYYSAAEGMFLRDGVEVSKDNTLAQLMEDNKNLKQTLNDYETAYTQGVNEA